MFLLRALIGATSKAESSVETSVDTLLLNGTSQDVDTTISTPSTAGTISLWVRRTSTGAFNGVFGDRSGSNSIALYIEASNTLRLTTNSDNTTSGSISDTNWHFIVLTWDSNNWNLYLDDVNIESYTETRVTNAATLAFGSDGGPNYFNGAITLGFMFDRALTSSERATLYNGGTPSQPWLLSPTLTDDALVLLPLNGGVNSGNEYKDYSGNGNDATANGSPTFTGTQKTIINLTDPNP